MSVNYSRRPPISRGPPPPPPPKKRTGLIVGIIIGVVLLIIVIIVVIILLRRRSSSGGSTTKCTSNSDCTGGKLCKTSTGVCVTCLSDSNCTGGQTCNTTTNVCQSPPCTTNADCTDPALPACVTGSCKQCTTSADCAANTIYSSVGKNTCETGTTHACVQCIVDADCPTAPNATCNSNVCCDKSPPTFGALTPTLAVNSTITGSYTWTQPNAGTTVTRSLQAQCASITASIALDVMTVAAVGGASINMIIGDFIIGGGVALGTRITQIISGSGGIGSYKVSISQTVVAGVFTALRTLFETAAAAPDGIISFSEAGTNVPLYPTIAYFITVKLVSSCATVYNTTSVTMPNSPVGYIGPPLGAGADVSLLNGFQIAGLNFYPDNQTSQVIMFVSPNAGLHPNLVGTGSDIGHAVLCNYSFSSPLGYLWSGFTAPWAGPPPVANYPTNPVVGSVWHARCIGVKGGNNGADPFGQMTPLFSSGVAP